jgi:hypothetical protein
LTTRPAGEIEWKRASVLTGLSVGSTGAQPAAHRHRPQNLNRPDGSDATGRPASGVHPMYWRRDMRRLNRRQLADDHPSRRSERETHVLLLGVTLTTLAILFMVSFAGARYRRKAATPPAPRCSWQCLQSVCCCPSA